MAEPPKSCLECGEIIRGRIDKKFCSDLCRNAYNNRIKADSNNYVRNVNNILRKNRKILEDFLPEETARIAKNKLVDKGFNFHHFTSVYTTKKGATYFYCYEFGYLPLDKDYFFLVKRKEGME